MTGLSQTHLRAIFSLIAAALMWSIGGVFFRGIPLPALAIAGGRSLFAAATLGLFMGRFPRPSFSIIFTSFCYFLVGASLILCTKMTSAATAIFLQYTAPLYIPIFLYYISNTPITRRDFIALTALIFGMAILCFDQLHFGSWLGFGLGVISGISFAAFIVGAKRLNFENRISAVFWGNILTALVGAPFFIGEHISGTTWIYLVFLGVIQLGIPYWLYTCAIEYVSSLESAFIPTLEPIFNPMWVYLFLGEPVGRLSILGGIIVIITVGVHSYGSIKRSLRDT